MEVLFVASECFPFIKTGGLADVVGSLPSELIKLGVDARVFIPKYKDIPAALLERITFKKRITVSLGWRFQHCGIEQLEYNGVTYYFLENEYYFYRSGIYGFSDDAERFAFFSRAVLEALPYLDFKPRILHCHDWHTGLISVFLKAHYLNNPFYKDIRTLFTIHNINYQGNFPIELLEELLDLGPEYFSMDALEFYGQGSYLKGGLVYADLLNTVSKTYAEEIQTPYFGARLDGLLKKRKGSLLGIVNGIDYASYDPMNDPHIFFPYRSSLLKKQANKLKLQQIFGFSSGQKIPMLAFVNRLVEQKGLDLIQHVLEEILDLGAQIVILGTGEEKYRRFFEILTSHYPEQLAAVFQFDEPLARRIYAASDMFLLPSRYEPCGMAQLIAMRYGSIPIVRETGGLKDTIVPFDENSKTGTGFSFRRYNAHDMFSVITKALELYKNKEVWSRLVNNAVKFDSSWKNSAREYQVLYRRLLER
ncbi:glycogen synthase GlgA [Candidatus Micrarchaeota archaeon]|nr:glycogen synthase GlgA [Candidatus Micrarchaeota archaeon]